jgi:hypothetical protein
MNMNTATMALLFLAAVSAADVATNVDAVVPEATVEEQFVETSLSATSMAEVTNANIADFNKKLRVASKHLDAVIHQGKQDVSQAIADRKKSEWDAARYLANKKTKLRTFPVNNFPVLVESTYSQCVYTPTTKFPSAAALKAPAVRHSYATHYKTLCAGEISSKVEKKTKATEAMESKSKKCEDTIEKSHKSSETTEKAFSKTQVNEGANKAEEKSVKELQMKLEKAQKKKASPVAPPAPAPVVEEKSPELCEKQGIAAEAYAKHSEKLKKAEEVTDKSKAAKEAKYKAAEKAKEEELSNKEVFKKSELVPVPSPVSPPSMPSPEVEPLAAPCTAESDDPRCHNEELEKVKHKEVRTKDEAESHGKEKAQKSAEAVAKTAKYEKKIKKELSAKKGKHDEAAELEAKAAEIKSKHPKKPDVEEELEKTKEKAYKSDSTNKEATSKVEMKLKKKAADSQEMKEKNENFSKAERKTKGAEIDSKNSEQECSNKSEKVSKEASTKVDSKDNEGSNKVATVEAAEQATKEKHSKNPFYGLDMYAKKIQGLKEVFTKTKAAYERKCKSKE